MPDSLDRRKEQGEDVILEEGRQGAASTQRFRPRNGELCYHLGPFLHCRSVHVAFVPSYCWMLAEELLRVYLAHLGHGAWCDQGRNCLFVGGLRNTKTSGLLVCWIGTLCCRSVKYGSIVFAYRINRL